MSEVSIWIGLSLITSLIFSLWWIPRKFAKDANVWTYNIYYSLWIMSIWVVLFFIFQNRLVFNSHNFNLMWLSVLSWIIASLWVVCFIRSIDLLWISTANAFKNTQPIFAFIFWGLFLWEFLSLNIIYTFIWALLIVVIWIILSKSSVVEFSKNSKYIYLPILSAIFLSFWMMLQKAVMDLWVWLFLILVWAWAFLFFYLISKIKKSSNISPFEKLMGFSSWSIISIGYLWAFYGYQYLEYSIAYSIINLNTLWVILISLVFFNELNWKDYKMRIILSMVISVIAIYMFYLAKI